MTEKLFILLLLTGTIFGKNYVVAETGGDYAKIQDAINVAVAGDTVFVKEKTQPYFESLKFKRSGNASNGYIVLAAYPNEHPIIDGTNFNAGDDWPQGLIKIINKNYIKVIGFEIRNLITTDNDWFPAGIWVRGKSHHIELLKNKIHNIEHNDADGGAHGIAVYGTSSSASIHNILLDGNEIYDCKLAWSESLVLNGNVENFIVTNNIVHDNNNIAFDFIGHEGECPNPALDQARNGLVKDNIAYNIDSRTNPSYEGEGSADGFYVDGGKDIIFERNLVYNCNIGFEVASEHGGKSTSGIIVRNNFIRNNISLGLAIGGYDSQRGSAENCKIVNNTFYKNNTNNDSWGSELLVQFYTKNNLIANNIIYSTSGTALINNTTNTGTNNTINNNLYFSDDTPKWKWGNNTYSLFDNYKTATTQESESIYSNPKLADMENGNINPLSDSPVIEKGLSLDSAVVGRKDYYGKQRVINNNIDIGAAEYDGATSVKLQQLKNNKFYIKQNYPNPFNPTTTIQYNIPVLRGGMDVLKNKENGTINSLSAFGVRTNVQLKVYDMLGREISTLVNKQQKPGNYKINFNANSLSSGIYYYSLKVKLDNKLIYNSTKQMVLLK